MSSAVVENLSFPVTFNGLLSPNQTTTSWENDTGSNDTESSHLPSLVSEDDLFREYDLILTQLAAVFCGIFVLVGVPGNLVTIIALAKCKKVRNATAYFIINLSVCDLLSCCFNLPLASSMFWNRRWIHGNTLCHLFPLFRYGLMAVSIFTVLAITINRYVMIGHPRVYPRLYQSKVLGVMVLLIWLGSFGALIPTSLGLWGRFDLDKEIGSCSILPDAHQRTPKQFLFLVAFVLPCCAIIICYARIFYIVRRATKNLHPPVSIEEDRNTGESNLTLSSRPSSGVNLPNARMSSKDRKLLWMILVIFGTFLICYLPITIFKAVVKNNTSPWNIFGYLLIYVTTCINPLVYVLMSSDYRQAYTNLFSCYTEWNSSNRTSSTNKT